MDNKRIIELIKENSYILPQHYKFNVWEESGVIFNIKLKDELLIRRIGCWIEQGIVVSDFGVFITLLEIEAIMTPILQKHSMFGNNDDGVMLTSSLDKLEPELFHQTLNPFYPKAIKTEQDLIDLLNDLKEYTENVAEPFFEKWSDLRVLDKFLDTVPQMEISNYLGGYGGFSKLLVYKLCNNPKFEEQFSLYYNYYINRYVEEPNGDIAIKQKHDFMIDFKEVLEKIEPKYNV